jgi:3-oxoadipate enol-lactonase/4-carboxymuconolactone decarboxylase
MPFAINDGVRLYWRLDGAADKPVLVLLNSIGTDLSAWDRALPYLVPHFRLLRMDNRGHGASDAPVGDYDLDTLAADTLAVMDAAGVATAAICGVSLGGMIAMTIAVTAPERVTALIPACTSAAMDVAAWTARVELVRKEGMAGVADLSLGRFLTESFRLARPEIADTLRNGLLSLDPAGYGGCCAAIRDMDLLSKIGALRVPTLVIGGTKDVSTPFEGHGDRIVAAIPGARSAIVEGPHLPMIEGPAAFAGVVVDFLHEIADGGAVTAASDALFEAGLKNRRAVLGDAWVDRSLAKRTPFNADFQAMITRIAWHEVWGRPGLDHRTRRLLVVAICAALGRWEEFRLHVRAGLSRGGFTRDELKEVLMQTAIYAGVPAANTGFSEAAEVMAEMEHDA